MDEVIEQVDATFGELDSKLDIYKEGVLTADSGFHSEESLKAVLSREVDAYIADTHFRSRDPRFAKHREHKKKTTDRDRTSKGAEVFQRE